MDSASENKRSLLIKILTNAIDNLDTLLSIILAIVAAVLSTFGGKVDIAIAATAGVLTIISISLLRDSPRQR